MLNNAWIDPEGKIHPVDWHEHGKFANRILGESLPSEHAIYKLASLGWIHIGSSPFIAFKTFRDISGQQASALYDMLDRVQSGIIKQYLISFIHGG